MYIVTGALFFAIAAYFGVLLAQPLSAKLDGSDETVRTFAPPAAAVVLIGAVLGAVLVSHAVSPAQIVLAAVAYVALAAIVMVDARYAIVPDVCTLAPLAAVLAFAVWRHNWWVVASALVPFVPFAVAALISNGYGMGWGDVKLAALGGALLGAELSVVALSAACIAAVVVARVVFKTKRAVPLGPFMAGAIALALPAAGIP